MLNHLGQFWTILDNSRNLRKRSHVLLVVYFREKPVSIKGEASTNTDLQLKGPAQLAVSTWKIKFKTLQDWKRGP